LIVQDMPETIKNSQAKKIFVMNLMTREGETYNYKASDHLEDLDKYLDQVKIDYVIINSDTNFSPELLSKYEEEGSYPVEDDIGDTWNGSHVIRTPLVSNKKVVIQKGDTISRSMIRHDADLLASSIESIISGKIT